MATSPDSPREGNFISKLVKDPKNPPQVQQIVGFIGAAGEPGRTRIYLDTNLRNYVEVMEDKVLHTEPVEGERSLGLSTIWLAADAQIFPPAQPRMDARSYFGGAVYQDYLGQAAGIAGGIGLLPSVRLLQCPSAWCTEACIVTHAPLRCWGQPGVIGPGGDPFAQPMAAGAAPQLYPTVQFRCPSVWCTEACIFTHAPLRCWGQPGGVGPGGDPFAQPMGAAAFYGSHSPNCGTWHCTFPGCGPRPMYDPYAGYYGA